MLAALGTSPDFSEFAVFVVWVPMLLTDATATAEGANADLVIDAPRFWDERRLAAWAVADAIGANGETAWDMYLFFSKDAVWDAACPPPVTWVHQLDNRWADRTKMACGPDLEPALIAAATMTLGSE